MTLREWFADFTAKTGETPTEITFGQGLIPFGPLLAAGGLDKEFDDGFGGVRSPDLCAWSPSWVLFSDQYDGAENLCWVPRNPTEHDPIRPGG